MLKSLHKKNKKGAYGIEIMATVVLGLFVFVMMVIGILVGISTLRSSNLITTPEENNASVNLMSNMTALVNTIASKFGLIGSVVVVVVIFGFIGLMIYIVRKFGGKESGM